jgi:hypothetical protein
MQTAIPCKYVIKLSQLSLVGSDAKNALPTSICTMDLVGLSCVFQEDEKYVRVT